MSSVCAPLMFTVSKLQANVFSVMEMTIVHCRSQICKSFGRRLVSLCDKNWLRFFVERHPDRAQRSCSFIHTLTQDANLLISSGYRSPPKTVRSRRTFPIAIQPRRLLPVLKNRNNIFSISFPSHVNKNPPAPP